MLFSADNFVNGELVSRDVKMADGTIQSIPFKPMGAVAFSSILGDDKLSPSERYARVIADSVCNPDGKPALKIDQVRVLKAQVFNALREAVLDVNGYGPKAEAETGKD